MSNNTNTKKLGGLFYFICVLMLIALLTTALMSALNNAKREKVKGGQSDSTEQAVESTETAERNSGFVFKENETTEKAETPKSPETEVKDEAASALPEEFTLPISGMILNKFNDTAPVFSPTMNDYRTHLGIDLQGKPGTQVKAFADGVIDAIYTDEFMGNIMVINHGGGMKSYYMNIGDSLPQGIEQGSEVKCGQTIAGVGAGSKLEALDESHLHFEVSLNGERVDPLGYIDHATLADYEYEGNEE